MQHAAAWHREREGAQGGGRMSPGAAAALHPHGGDLHRAHLAVDD
jgi:hypothetical protein